VNHYEKFLIAQNADNLRRNAPQIATLKQREGHWGERKLRAPCREPLNLDIGVETIQLLPVFSTAQVQSEVWWLNSLWPTNELLDKAESNYEDRWRRNDLFRAARRLRKDRKRVTAKNLCPLMHANEKAEWEQRPGISIREYRRRFTLTDTRTARRFVGQAPSDIPCAVRTGKAIREDDKLGLPNEEIGQMTIRSKTGWKLTNDYSGAEQ
jgi:hypothetical protein